MFESHPHIPLRRLFSMAKENQMVAFAGYFIGPGDQFNLS